MGRRKNRGRGKGVRKNSLDTECILKTTKKDICESKMMKKDKFDTDNVNTSTSLNIENIKSLVTHTDTPNIETNVSCDVLARCRLLIIICAKLEYLLIDRICNLCYM